MSPDTERKPYMLEVFSNDVDSEGLLASSSLDDVAGRGTQCFGRDFKTGADDIASEVRANTSHDIFKEQINEVTSKVLTTDVIKKCYENDFLLGLKGCYLYVLAKREYKPKYVSFRNEYGTHQDYALSDIDDYIEAHTETTEPHPDYYDVRAYNEVDEFISMKRLSLASSAYEIPIYKLTERLRQDCYIAIPLSNTKLIYKYDTNGNKFREYHTNHSGKLCVNSFSMGVDNLTAENFDVDELERIFDLVNSRSEVINTSSVYRHKPEDNWPNSLWIKNFIKRNKDELPQTDIRSW